MRSIIPASGSGRKLARVDYGRDMAARRPALYGGGVLTLVLDCSDLERAGAFWAPALGYRPEGPRDRYLRLLPETGDGIELLLQQVPEEKAVKNRMHLDLRVRDLEAEVGRICALGARRLTTEPMREWGWCWHVLADPDGNELCVLQPSDAYWAGVQ